MAVRCAASSPGTPAPPWIAYPVFSPSAASAVQRGFPAQFLPCRSAQADRQRPVRVWLPYRIGVFPALPGWSEAAWAAARWLTAIQSGQGAASVQDVAPYQPPVFLPCRSAWAACQRPVRVWFLYGIGVFPALPGWSGSAWAAVHPPMEVQPVRDVASVQAAVLYWEPAFLPCRGGRPPVPLLLLDWSSCWYGAWTVSPWLFPW